MPQCHSPCPAANAPLSYSRRVCR
ncbi:hypothetical protein E2C01_047450 [Portunus trituberculatus]|uniref:Uncharacterized protein n=1 Tax=Portunus trituberculatus TaxID=210409 RepID=A0A5B7G7Y8_PORTR|nr:hypothetical protein [Portunus trituberculatus]